MKGISKRLT